MAGNHVYGATASHPQRLFPRYAPLMRRASAVPGGLLFASRLLASIAFDAAHSDTENPTPADFSAGQVAVCGFPRTGTTSMEEAVAAALGGPGSCFKNHDPLAIARFVEAGVPVIVTLRGPMATVVSWSLYHHDEPRADLLDWRLQAYTAWHRELRHQLPSPWIRLVDFGRFTDAPARALTVALRDWQTNAVSPSDITSAVHARNSMAGTDVRRTNVPHPERDGLKDSFMAAARSRRVQRSLKQARQIYSDLVLHCEI